MASASSLYRKLCRLREKYKRLARRIARMERCLAGKKDRWGNCSMAKNRNK